MASILTLKILCKHVVLLFPYKLTLIIPLQRTHAMETCRLSWKWLKIEFCALSDQSGQLDATSVSNQSLARCLFWAARGLLASFFRFVGLAGLGRGYWASRRWAWVGDMTDPVLRLVDSTRHAKCSTSHSTMISTVEQSRKTGRISSDGTKSTFRERRNVFE